MNLLRLVLKHLAGKHDQKKHGVQRDFDPLEEDNLDTLRSLGIKNPEAVYPQLKKLGSVRLVRTTHMNYNKVFSPPVSDLDIIVAGNDRKTRYVLRSILAHDTYLHVDDFSTTGNVADFTQTINDLNDAIESDPTGLLGKKTNAQITLSNDRPIQDPRIWDAMDAVGMRIVMPPDVVESWIDGRHTDVIRAVSITRDREFPVGGKITPEIQDTVDKQIRNEIDHLDTDYMTIAPSSLGPVLRTVLGQGPIIPVNINLPVGKPDEFSRLKYRITGQSYDDIPDPTDDDLREAERWGRENRIDPTDDDFDDVL